MSRFGNLEFGEERGKPRGDAAPSVKNEAYYLDAAREAFDHGKFDDALRHYAKALEHNPLSLEAWAGQVRMMIELRQLQEAGRWVDKGREAFPTSPELMASSAVIVAVAGDFDAALAFSDAAIERGGELPWVWISRGSVFLVRGDDQAKFCFQKAEENAPNDWRIPWQISRACFAHKQFALALKHARQAANLDAGRSVLWLQLGHCQRESGLLTEAAKSFRQAVELDATCEEGRMALVGMTGLGMGQRVTAFFRKFRE